MLSNTPSYEKLLLYDNHKHTLKSLIVIHLNKLATALCECVHVCLVLQVVLAEGCSQWTS